MVFPRGLGAPRLMWENNCARAVLVHMKSSLFEYAGCLPVQGGVVKLPEDVWAAAGAHTRFANDPMSVELTALTGQGVAGPAKTTISIAAATLKGSVYYNSYNSFVAIGSGAASGAVLRVRSGRQVELFARSGACSGCHSLSANGQRLLALNFAGLNLGSVGSGLTGTGMVFSITPETGQNPPTSREGANASFAGLSPDGRFYVTSASSTLLGPLLNGGLAAPNTNAQLVETDTGRVVPSAIPRGAMMPSFSPDGRLLTFVDLGQNGGRNVSVMDFDPATGAAANPRVVYTPANGNVGWPFVLPDNRAVIFTLTESGNFTGGSSYIVPAVTRGPRSDLMMVELKSGSARLLANAMGYRTPQDAAAETTYLPFGAEELHQAYYPTVSPVAAGGYFWLFFDSVRHFGNKGGSRQIWGTAIRFPGGEFSEYDPDPSAPAFYLEGQEFGTANHRGFTALDPCKADGQSCESGVDCCSGFCTDGVCGAPVARCSAEGEACKSAADCCNPRDECVAGFCSAVLK
jgi:WD40-like Beta Propeller Repeat